MKKQFSSAMENAMFNTFEARIARSRFYFNQITVLKANKNESNKKFFVFFATKNFEIYLNTDF